MEVKFDDSESIQEILQVIAPLIENIPCFLMVKDVAKGINSLPRNDSHYHHIFDKLFVTVEMELVKLAIASPGFTICFEQSFDHFHVDKNVKSSFLKVNIVLFFSLGHNTFITLLISKAENVWFFYEIFE